MLKENPNDQIVILIDALDELRYFRGEHNILDWLATCPELPSNVRFVLTSRSEGMLDNLRQRQQKWLRQVTIDQQSGDVQNDVSYYAKSFASQERVKKVLAKQQIEENEFTTQVVKKADGNFQYLAALFQGIEQAQKMAEQEQLNRLLKLEDLPAGQEELYAFFLTLIKDSVANQSVDVSSATISVQKTYLPAWEGLYQPILGILSVAREPLELEQIVNFGNFQVEQRWVKEAFSRLEQFLRWQGDCCLFYHSTFPEFLTSSRTQTKHSKFYLDTTEWHKKIARYYRNGASTCKDVDWEKVKDNYAFEHLVYHLYDAKLKDELYRLLTGSPKWMKAKFAKFSSDATYVNELKLAINEFTDPLDATQLLTLVKLYTARQVVHQRTSSYKDIDLKTLVWLGREAEALGYARLRDNANKKFAALMNIHKALQEKSQINSTVLDANDVLNEAVEVAQMIIEKDPVSLEEKTILLDFATALVQAKNFTEAKKLANEISNILVKVKVLLNLALALSLSGNSEEAIAVFGETKELINAMDQDWDRAEALRELAATLGKAGDAERASEFFSKAEDVTRAITDTRNKVEELIKLAATLAPTRDNEEAGALFIEAEKLAHTMKNSEQIQVLLILALALAQAGFTEKAEAVFIEVEELVTLKKDRHKADALQWLALVRVQAKDVKKAITDIKAAMKVPNGFEEKDWEPTSVVSKFAETLIRNGFPKEARAVCVQARELALTIKDNSQRAEELRKLAAILAQTRSTEEASKVFAEAEKLASATEKDSLHEQALLSKWAAALNQVEFVQEAQAVWTDDQKVAQAAKEIEEDWKKVEALRKKVTDPAQVGDAVEQSSEQKQVEALRLLIETYLEQEVELQDWEREQVMSVLATSLVQIERFTEALSTLGLKERANQFLDNLAGWVLAFEKVEKKLSVKILEETTSIFGWMYSEWRKISTKFVKSKYLFSIPPQEAERLDACIQEAITIIDRNIQKSELIPLERIEKIVKSHMLHLVNTEIDLFYQDFQ
ncbi:MAG: hypothetical protein ICV78_06690 [Tolypothrix sp. Co-bin9]|nr:hypothetical protein [Tolypothrix sp. Co-bin9]